MSNETLLSILIPTMESRKDCYLRLRAELDQQISATQSDACVEILSLLDDGSRSVGAKRNQLMDMACGMFIVFVDDDDRVGSNYVSALTSAIRENPDVDCISFNGEIAFRSHHQRLLVHSIKYTDWLECNGRYLRPPCHITPIRKDIAQRYLFADVDYAEDIDWSMRMCRDKVLRKEIALESTLYHYDSRRLYAWQWVLDRTQGTRHALGLRYVNGVALRHRLVSFFRASGS